VVIVGAGIGGLATALALHAVGIEAVVLESARQIRPLGVGINLQPPAVGELIRLGLGEDLASIGVATAEHAYVDRRGRIQFREPRGPAAGHRWPQYSVHRGRLQLMLLAAVRKRLGEHAVRTGRRLTALEPGRGRPLARVLDRATGATEQLEPEVLIAADGLHSAARAALHPGEGPLRWSGVQMWRGVAEAEPFLTGRSMVLGNDERQLRFLAYPISPPSAGRSVLVNWVCQAPVAEPGPAGGDVDWNQHGRLDDILPRLTDWSIDWLDVPGLIQATEPILEYPMVDRDPLAGWGLGSVTLLGDAAHPMYPVGANGASQAVIDGAVLARELASGVEPRIALARYECVRRPATTAVIEANRAMDRAERAGSAAPGGPDTAQLAAITRGYREATS
jgi:5-methylphenazine-1-carboxylate 1-monooxygenase